MSKSQANWKWVCAVPLVAVVAIASFVLLFGSHRRPEKTAAVPAAARIRSQYAALPLAFEQNQGQTDAQVKYMARGDGYTLFLTPNEAVFSLRSPSKAGESSTQHMSLGAKNFSPAAQPETTAVVRMKLDGANLPAKVCATDMLPGKSNYFIGNDRSKWHSGLPNYARISYEDVYPGVNLAFHGLQRQTEFDFLVAPGADPTPIAFNFSGAKSVTNDDAGNLVVSSAAGNLVLHKPVAYQEINGSRDLVDAKFVMRAGNKVGIALGEYDHGRELVIDPTVTVAFSTYLGGSGDDAGQGIAVDGSGNIWIAGATASTNFPVTNGSTLKGKNGYTNAFVAEISGDGSSLLFSAFVGGNGNDAGGLIDGDSGNALTLATSTTTTCATAPCVFVAGGTNSSSFPVTNSTTLTGAGNAFVFELSSTGALTFSTYLGGSLDVNGNPSADTGLGIASDSSGNVTVVGKTSATNFPTTPSPLQAYVSGSVGSGFVTRLTPSGTGSLNLVYSTYLGGSTTGDSVNAVALDGSNNAYVAGQTFSSSFPTHNPYQSSCGGCPSDSNAFVTSINAAGDAYNYSTYLGGSGSDAVNGIAVDSTGNAYVTGITESENFPITNSGYQQQYQGNTDAFVGKLTAQGSLTYSTYLGGSNFDVGASIAVDSSGNAYVTGQTSSCTQAMMECQQPGTVAFPLANATQPSIGGGDTDAFVAEMNSSGTQLVFSTYLGGAGDEDVGGNYGAIAVSPTGTSIYVTGNTNPVLVTTNNFPTTTGAYQANPQGGMDAFITTYSQPTTPSFTLGATTPPAVQPGNNAMSTITLTADNNYSYPVNLTCNVNNAPMTSCSFLNTPVTPASGVGATTTLTITTTAPGLGSPQHRKHLLGVWLAVPGLMLVGILFSVSPEQRRKVLCSFLVAIVAVSFTLMPGCGSNSNSGGGGGTCGAAPGAPTGLAGSNTTSTATTLNWTAPSGLGANCSISGYTIYQNGTQIGTSSTTSFNVTGLAPSTTYNFTVAASDSAGLGAQSSAASVTTGSAGTPAGTYNITITATGTDPNTTTQTMNVTLTVN